MLGTIFETREFSIFDGGGIRTTVFLKGCPLHCEWCHNPEGMRFEPEILFNEHKCIHCGNCKKICPSPGKCIVCGTCARKCPSGARKICGFSIDSDILAAQLMKQADVFRMSGGGVTFSGGEPLAQASFVNETAKILKQNGIHTAVETSGAVSTEAYKKGTEFIDFIFQDLKLPEVVAFRRYCGGDLDVVMKNVAWLKTSGKPFIFRIPLIPNVNDSEKCMIQFAQIAEGCETLQRVEILPYHLTAGAKYHLVGKTYTPSFDEERVHPIITAPFDERGISCKVL